jgi:catechol 2,3-dioxygenase-like lactoylglutathione lyase family enzyme
MIKRMDNAFFYVSNAERALIFYRDVLGLQPTFVAPSEWLEFQVGAAGRLALNPAGAPIPHTGGVVVFEVDNVERFVARLREHGVRIRRDVHLITPGKMIEFEDPDGNVLQALEYVNWPAI